MTDNLYEANSALCDNNNVLSLKIPKLVEQGHY